MYSGEALAKSSIIIFTVSPFRSDEYVLLKFQLVFLSGLGASATITTIYQLLKTRNSIQVF